MNNYQYLILLGLCLTITLPLEFVLKARVYRRWRWTLLSIGVVVLIFGIWDLVGIARNHWWYNEEFITGVHLGPLPLEELLFFIAIPLCGLLSYEGVGHVLELLKKRRRSAALPEENS